MKDTLSGSILGYLEGLKVTQGRMAGEPFPCSPGSGVSSVVRFRTTLSRG